MQTMNVGARPPPNSVVKNAKNVKKFLNLKSFLKSAYEYRIVIRRLEAVPTIVMKKLLK